MKIRPAQAEDAAAIAAIFNYEVDNSPEIWVETHVTPESRREWIAARQADSFPVLVAEADGQMVGFGSYGSFRPYEGFRQTVEHLVYVAASARGKGIGHALLEALIDLARRAGKKVLVGAVDSERILASPAPLNGFHRDRPDAPDR